MTQSWEKTKPLNLILPGNCLHLQKNQALFHDYSFLFLKAHLLTFDTYLYTHTVCAQSIRRHLDFCKRGGLGISPFRECCTSLAWKSSTVQATEHFSVDVTESAHQPGRGESRAPKHSPGWDTALESPQLSCTAQVQGFTPSLKGKEQCKMWTHELLCPCLASQTAALTISPPPDSEDFSYGQANNEGSFNKAPWDWILRAYFKFFQRTA